MFGKVKEVIVKYLKKWTIRCHEIDSAAVYLLKQLEAFLEIRFIISG